MNVSKYNLRVFAAMAAAALFVTAGVSVSSGTAFSRPDGFMETDYVFSDTTAILMPEPSAPTAADSIAVSADGNDLSLPEDAGVLFPELMTGSFLAGGDSVLPGAVSFGERKSRYDAQWNSIIYNFNLPVATAGSLYSPFGICGCLPVQGNAWLFLSDSFHDVSGLYMQGLKYAGAGMPLADGASFNAGVLAGYHAGLGGGMIMTGGRAALMLNQSEPVSFILWGQYMNMTGTVPSIALPSGTNTPWTAQRVEIGAQANFKIGDFSFGIGASYSQPQR